MWKPYGILLKHIKTYYKLYLSSVHMLLLPFGNACCVHEVATGAETCACGQRCAPLVTGGLDSTKLCRWCAAMFGV